MRFLALNYNGIWPNGLDARGSNVFEGWNKFFRPDQFSQANLGENWIDPNLLGSKGVGNLANIPGINDNIMDNRFINEDLKDMLCQGDPNSTDGGDAFREYFSTLVEAAWPANTEFWLCCSEPAGRNAKSACNSPDHVFSSNNKSEDESDGQALEPLLLAPHFLTQKFESGQQEALTAAVIAKFNTQGIHLKMDLTGRFDLGAAGTRFISARDPGFGNYLGNAWGNMFLDCDGDDANHALCLASSEQDRFLGRDSQFHSLPMFTCKGPSNYPTKESGKACFSKDMATNIQDGCGLVAATGMCDEVCVGGFCGVDMPPVEGHGTTNVLYIYMSDYYPSSNEKSKGNLGIKIALPILFLVLVLGTLAFLLKKRKTQSAKYPLTTESKDDKETDTDHESEQDVETSTDE